MSPSAKHPWQLTVEEQAQRIAAEYGQAAAEDFLELALLNDLELDEVLEPERLRSLLVGVDLPPHDFGLDPYPGGVN